MAGEWQLAKIGDIAERVAMGPFGSSIKVETFVPSGVPVISGQHLRGTKVDDKVGFNFVSESHAQRLRNANVQRGDVIFTHAGNIGQVAFVPESAQFERYVISQRQFYMRCNRDKILPEFVVAYFKTPKGQHSLLANTSQVGVPSIAQPVTYLRTIEIPLPPLSEQRAIAHILGTLDDKIELNRRMSETLEAMARALFKAWFVDFEPVRAKAHLPSPPGRRPTEVPKGRPTEVPKGGDGGEGSAWPQHILDLFPDRLVDSELGAIPQGWEQVKLPDVIAVNPARPLRKDKVAPYLDMANMPTRGHTADDVIDRPFGSGMRFMNGDTLVARITPCLENGKTAYVDFLQDGQIGWGSTEYIVLRPKPPLPGKRPSALPEEFAYCLARSDGFREFAIQSMTGSSGRQRVPAESLSHYLLAAPSQQISDHFGAIVRPLFARASIAAHESRTLATLRDTLLPKLISGGLRVQDAERFISEGVA